MQERSSIAVEQLDGDTYATWETDGRSLTVGDVYVTSAQSEDEARTVYVVERLARTVERWGSIDGERLG